MKKQFRKLSLAVVFAMAVSLVTPAAQVAEAATTKTFTYAEQQTGDNVKTLVMDKGEKVDLKFNGVSNWKTYKYKWASSNTKVAVVDSAGVITAINTGVATIKLTVSGGDGTQYTSTGVTVYVGMDQSVTIGTGTKEEIKSHTMEMGQSVMLKANGIKDNVAGRYTFDWSSTDTTVATINSNGVITAKAPGLTVIQLTVKKVSSGAVMEATPIALLVTEKGGSVAPAATATPVPTQKPGATATPTPTATPKATATPTPTPAVAAGNYSVTVTSDKSVTVNFGSKVSYTKSDVKLSQIIEAGSEDIPIEVAIESVKLDDTGKKMVITSEDILENGKYNIKIGTSDKGKDFSVSIGAPNRLEIVYTCLGQNGVAYAYSDEAGIDVPVQLSYKVYSGNVEVTESYETNGYVTFELVSPTNSANVMMDGEQLYFYATKQTAAVSATYAYVTENGTEKELKDTVSIISKAMGAYKVTNVAKWTIIDDNDKSAIDWNNTVNKVVAGKEGYKVVALLADSYGYYYTTDERGVDKENNIYWIEDPDTLFSMKGYSCSFNSSDDDNLYIDVNGDLYPRQASSRASTYITLYNTDEYTSGEKKMSAWYFTIQAEAKLSNLQIEETNINMVIDAVDHPERFCQTDVVVKLYDQYNEKWNGDADLEVTSNVADVTNSIYSIASVEKGTAEGEWLLHIDAAAMADATTRTSVTLYVTDVDTKKKDSIIVYLKNPETKDKGIVVKNWAVGLKDTTIAFGDGDLAEESARAEIEVYKVSQQGNYNVGYLLNGSEDEHGNEVEIILQTKTSLDKKDVKAGQIYVLVQDPKKNVLKEKTSSDLGLWQDKETGAVYVNISKKDGESLTFMDKGVYSVSVTKITKDGATTTPKKANFTVTDNTKNVSLAGYNRKTSKSVSYANDPAAVDIVLELFKFELGGVAWTNIDASNIVSVTHTAPVNNKIGITEIEFSVPADGKDSTVRYQKKLKLNATITINQ